MLLCQISDLHVGFDGNDPAERNSVRLRDVIGRVATLDPAPDLVILSGDLAENGAAFAYARVREMIARLPMPVLVMAGNHDRRAALLHAFPATETADGFVQYAREWPDRRLLVLDTLDEGRGGGGWCPTRAAWLAARLAERPDTPTLLALHHPPFPVGIDWMDPAPDAPWIERLRPLVAANPQIVSLIAGHLHRPVVGCWAGTACVVASSVAPQLALELRPTPTHPDGRALIVLEPPSFVLHRWTDAGLASHFVRVEPAPPIVWLDKAMAPIIAAYLNEGQGD